MNHSSSRKRPSLRNLPAILVATGGEAMPAFVLVFKLTFPIILCLRIIEDFIPLVAIISGWLFPLMGIVGLPDETALPWIAAILIQPIASFALRAGN